MSGRHQESCHLFQSFSVSLKVKGHGAKCLSLTRCMCDSLQEKAHVPIWASYLYDLTVAVFVSDSKEFTRQTYSRLMEDDLIIAHMIRDPVQELICWGEPKSWHHFLGLAAVPLASVTQCNFPFMVSFIVCGFVFFMQSPLRSSSLDRIGRSRHNM